MINMELAWYRQLVFVKTDVEGAPVIMMAPEGSPQAINNGPCTFHDVIVSAREDEHYQGADLPLYHLATADGRIITARWEEMRVDKGGQVEALNRYIDKAFIVTEQINGLSPCEDFNDPLDLLKEGTAGIVSAFYKLTNLD